MWDKRCFGGFEPCDLGLQNNNPKFPQEIQSSCVVVVHQVQYHTLFGTKHTNSPYGVKQRVISEI